MADQDGPHIFTPLIPTVPTPPLAVTHAWNAGWVVLNLVALAIVIKILITIGLLGRTRKQKKIYRNPEDAESQGGEVSTEDEDVIRISKIHLNDIDTFPIFYITFFGGYLEYVYTAEDQPRPVGLLVLAIFFLIFRCAHGVCFYFGLQPWRTVVFVLGESCTVIGAFLQLGWLNSQCYQPAPYQDLSFQCHLKVTWGVLLCLHVTRRLVVASLFPFLRIKNGNVGTPEDAKLVKGADATKPPSATELAVQELHHAVTQNFVIPLVAALASSYPPYRLDAFAKGPDAHMVMQGFFFTWVVLYTVLRVIPGKVPNLIALAMLAMVQVFGLVLIAWNCDSSLATFGFSGDNNGTTEEESGRFTFGAVTGCTLVLYLKQIFLQWFYTARSMATAESKEDETPLTGGTASNDAQAVRLSNMVSNDTENIPIMILISYAIALSNKSNTAAVFGGVFIIIFTIARVGMSLAHFLAFQPWRSIAWAAGMLMLIAQVCLLQATNVSELERVEPYSPSGGLPVHFVPLPPMAPYNPILPSAPYNPILPTAPPAM